MKLIAVRTVYDQVFYVQVEHLAGDKIMLLVYRADYKRAKHRIPGGSATDWKPTTLHRDNICPHDRTTWTAYTFPDGRNGDYCPICFPDTGQVSNDQ